MAFLKRLYDLLKIDRTPYQPALLEFPAVDPIKLANEYQVHDRGVTRGRRNEPPQNIGGHDEDEHRIIGAMEGFRSSAEASLMTSLETYASRLAKLDNAILINTVDHELGNAISDFKTGVRTDANRLYVLKKNVVEAEYEYEEFRRRNKLARTAKYPAHKFKNLSVALLLALIDTIANAYFFSLTHPKGWLGAIFESVFISGMNVVLGTVTGFFLARGCNLRNPFIKSLSALGLILSIVFLLGANIFAAHYRDAFASFTTRDLVSAEAFRLLLEKRWLLAGFQSYLMVLLGMFVAIFSLYEGYALDDAYPGFGIVARNRVKHVNEYSNLKELLLQGLEERKNSALSEIGYSIQEIKRRDEEFATVLEGRRTLVQRYNAFLSQLERTGNQLLETYRSANRETRKEPAPSTFTKPWNPNWAPYNLPPDSNAANRAVESRNLTDRLSKAPAAFLEAYNEAVSEYERIDAIVTREALQNARPEKS